MNRGALISLILIPVVFALITCQQPAEVRNKPSGSPRALVGSAIVQNTPGLQNLIQVTPGVYSGSMPEGDAGFNSLELHGIRSIVSVDGIRPDLERAAAHGMRYVHVPIQYNGIEVDAQFALARAMRDLPRPIYFHCHHGIHRGPTAAAYGLIATGTINSSAGLTLLYTAGTSQEYPGLHHTIRDATRLDDRTISERGGDLPEYAAPSGFVQAMATIDRSWSHLELLRANEWVAPPTHPDLVAPVEAAIIHDAFRIAAGDLTHRSSSDDFDQRMRHALQHADQFEQALLRSQKATADAIAVRLSASCTACHTRYRNRPASGKPGF